MPLFVASPDEVTCGLEKVSSNVWMICCLTSTGSKRIGTSNSSLPEVLSDVPTLNLTVKTVFYSPIVSELDVNTMLLIVPGLYYNPNDNCPSKDPPVHDFKKLTLKLTVL